MVALTTTQRADLAEARAEVARLTPAAEAAYAAERAAHAKHREIALVRNEYIHAGEQVPADVQAQCVAAMRAWNDARDEVLRCNKPLADAQLGVEYLTEDEYAQDRADDAQRELLGL